MWCLSLYKHHRRVNEMDRTCIVFGANGGMGNEILRALLEEEYKVIGFYHHSKNRIEKFANFENVKFAKIDLLDLKNLDQYKLRGITDVIFAAGKENTKGILQATYQDFYEQYNINVFSPLLILKYLLKSESNKLENVIFISSNASRYLKPSNGVYALSKACVNNLVKMLDNELRKNGTRVNAILPGWCDTDMAKRIALSKNIQMSQILESRLEKSILNVKEISQICMYLLSENSKHIHGQIIEIDVPKSEMEFI